MSEPKIAAFFFCADPEKDPVAPRVLRASKRLLNLKETFMSVDGRTVLSFKNERGDLFLYVRTDEVLSDDYPRYLPALNAYFADLDFAGLVNWHEGENAPEAILTVHTTGDVPSGYFGAAHPNYTRALLLCLEEERQRLGLDRFTTTTEATHWSGAFHASPPELITEYAVPLVDVEIGSEPASWSDEGAAEVIARALPRIFERAGDRQPLSLLCVGGVHFESSFAAAVLGTPDDQALAVSHILPNQWIVSGGYDDTEEGLVKLKACIASIVGGVQGIAYHEKLKGTYKQQLRILADQLGVPHFKHKALRQPSELGLW